MNRRETLLALCLVPLAVRSAVAAIKGEEVPAQQLLPPTLVTKENVADPNLWGNRFKP